MTACDRGGRGGANVRDVIAIPMGPTRHSRLPNRKRCGLSRQAGAAPDRTWVIRERGNALAMSLTNGAVPLATGAAGTGLQTRAGSASAAPALEGSRPLSNAQLGSLSFVTDYARLGGMNTLCLLVQPQRQKAMPHRGARAHRSGNGDEF